MAETTKTGKTDLTGTEQQKSDVGGQNISQNIPKTSSDFKERVSNVAQNVTHRVSDVTHNLTERFKSPENRSLMYVGIGVLGIGVGFGIWALVRYFIGRGEESEMADLYAEDFRRSEII